MHPIAVTWLEALMKCYMETHPVVRAEPSGVMNILLKGTKGVFKGASRKSKNLEKKKNLFDGRGELHLHKILGFFLVFFSYLFFIFLSDISNKPSHLPCNRVSVNQSEKSYNSFGSNTTWHNAVLCEVPTSGGEHLLARRHWKGAEIWADDATVVFLFLFWSGTFWEKMTVSNYF